MKSADKESKDELCPGGVGRPGGGPQRLGILGGSFDPIHNGHLAVARHVRDILGLQAVHLVTAKIPPHKQGKYQASAAHRHAMVELAVKGDPALVADDCEVKRPGPSYTVDTLRDFRRRFPEAELFFIVGADTIPELNSWYRLPEILKLCRIVTVTRPGYPRKYEPRILNRLDAAQVEELNKLVFPIPPQPVSSTEIRRKVACGEPIEGLVPPAVQRYIHRHGLYRQQGDRIE